MDLERARFLISPAGRQALEAYAHLETADPLRLAAELRKDLTAAQAAAVAEQLTLAAKARARFGRPLKMLLSAGGLEMMTHPLVAARRAERLAESGSLVLDLTCGLGGDLRFLARHGPAAGLERHPPTALLAAANLPGTLVAVGDARRPPFELERSAVFIDPSRRAGARRTFEPSAYAPSWDVCLALAGAARTGALKAAPGVPLALIPSAAEIEAVQVGRSLREVTLWLGEGARPGVRRAVLLPAGAEIDSTAPECPPDPVEPGPFLIDPESCVTRAGLVRHLGAAMRARLIDPNVAYLASAEAALSPLAATFEVIEQLPFSVSRVSAALRRLGLSAGEIRRRAFSVEPDSLRGLLGPQSGEPVTLLCTTIGGRRTVFIGRRVTEQRG